MPEIISRKRDLGRFEFCLDAVAVLLFTALVYIPLLLLFSRLIAGKSEPDFMFFRKYRIHAATLFSIWGLLFLITAPVQYVIPHFLIIDPFEISAGYLIRSILAAVHTVWAVKLLNALTGPQAFFVAMLSSISLPMLYLLI